MVEQGQNREGRRESLSLPHKPHTPSPPPTSLPPLSLSTMAGKQGVAARGVCLRHPGALRSRVVGVLEPRRVQGRDGVVGQDGARLGRGHGGVPRDPGGALQLRDVGVLEPRRVQGRDGVEGQDGARLGRGHGGLPPDPEGAPNRGVGCWSPDGSKVATGSGDKTARVWDAATGECLMTLKGHSSA